MTATVRRKIKLSVTLICAIALLACDTNTSSSDTLIDVTEISGLKFAHINGMSGDFFLPEMMGGGVALLDYDADGDLDVYLVQSGHQKASLNRGADNQEYHAPLTDQLYRNHSNRSGLRFENITASVGLQPGDYSMGAAVGDVNNDGYPDLYITSFGLNRLLINNQGDSFTESTQASGVQSQAWSISATFIDVNQDSWLDLYVGNYVDYRINSREICRSVTSARDYCTVAEFTPVTDQLWINKSSNVSGFGVFTEQSRDMGITQRSAAALGVVNADFNGDGWPDIFVANNGSQNQLWLNENGKQFGEFAGMAGVAFGLSGELIATRTVLVADYDNQGDPDLFVTTAAHDSNRLFLHRRKNTFLEATITRGLVKSSHRLSGFGAATLDINGDGLLDVFVGNGATSRLQQQIDAGDKFPLRQRNQLLLNTDSGFVERNDLASGVFQRARVSRGVASGDLDNDGDRDLIVVNNNSVAEVIENMLNPVVWLGIVPRLNSGGRIALNARVELMHERVPTVRWVSRSGSYASSSDPRVQFYPTQTDQRSYNVAITWPGGERELYADLSAGFYHDLIQGQGSQDYAITHP